MKLAQPDRDVQARELRIKELAEEDELRHLVAELDTDSSGSIRHEEFQKLEKGKLKAHLSVLGLDMRDAQMFFSLLAECSEDSEVDIESFVTGCMRLKGV